MEFGIMFFSSVATQPAADRYRLLVEAARFADRHGFCALWTPERHFHPFGGLFPDPVIVSAALAMITDRIQIRAGSLISPLHDTIRIAESWSVVDNLSRGRIAISFGSGWNVDDFVFFPERYGDRHAVVYRQIEEVKALWRGGRISRHNNGRQIEVEIFPKPMQQELPVWLTSSGNARTFESAGVIGANLLTHLIGQSVEELADKIRRYRQARTANGFDPHEGKVTLMMHTFLGIDLAAVREKVRPALREYLRSAISLEQMAAQAGSAISGGHRIEPHEIAPQDLEDLLDITFERYFDSASLMGTPEARGDLIWKLREIGVDEVACLIDFLPEVDEVMASLALVNDLRAAFAPTALAAAADRSVATFLSEVGA